MGQETSRLPDSPEPAQYRSSPSNPEQNGREYNTSELARNAAAAGTSNVYYPAADRSFGNTANKRGQQMALDAFFNVTKEFWPDARKKLFGR
jgi:hypothetical protein